MNKAFDEYGEIQPDCCYPWEHVSNDEKQAADAMVGLRNQQDVFAKLNALHTNADASQKLKKQNDILTEQNKELLRRNLVLLDSYKKVLKKLEENEKELTQLTLTLYTNGLRNPNGIGCNKCYPCVTGGSKPCLNVKKKPKKITRCQATTKSGKKCSRKPTKDGYCKQHC